ncbi:MAG: carbohydrate ABC transporter permease [Defluviitaleaceae bacterium]|nr:carbohydrate ABC transporter permease [Defluviitaleaceae bacterium]MCL2275909.1 carbohydrate ABC transporter permease [Defluviitaleaceae bacterium]
MVGRKLKGATIGDWVIVLIMIGIILMCILPVLTVVANSLSDPGAIVRQQVTFIPRLEVLEDGGDRLFPIGARFDAYVDILSDSRFMRSLGWTIILTFIATIFSLVMTVLCAYPLTYDNLKGRGFITVAVIFTMYFQAGWIPTFVLYRDLGLLDNRWVLVLPGFISVFLLIIMRKFFLGIPDSLRESAEIDGAGPFRILARIYLPLSTPVLATVGLMYAVGRWNGFTDALWFLRSAPEWHPIQLVLFNILQGIVPIDPMDPGMAAAPGRSETVQAAAIVVAMVPILCVYPWLQKYFVSGVTLGAVKG